MRLLRLSLCLSFCIFGLTRVTFAHSAAAEMTAAAQNLLNALTSEQKGKACFEFAADERQNWHFVPKPRQGLPLADMTPAQSPLAHALLASALSQRGYIKANTIMSLEQILFDIENSRGPKRDAALYYFTFFGKPGSGTWGWRVEGHHLSLNFVVQGDEVLAVTPSFFGANPARILEGPRKDLRTLAQEEDLGRALIKSLDSEQQKIAIITNAAPRDIITGNSRQAKALEPVGIAVSRMTPQQKETLFSLLREYLFRYRNEIAEPEFKRIQAAGEDKLFFAWAGGVEPGQGHYYRIQGGWFLIEYDNTQDRANHVHSVWRDLEHDFGGDALRRHYDQEPHPK